MFEPGSHLSVLLGCTQLHDVALEDLQKEGDSTREVAWDICRELLKKETKAEEKSHMWTDKNGKVILAVLAKHDCPDSKDGTAIDGFEVCKHIH